MSAGLSSEAENMILLGPLCVYIQDVCKLLISVQPNFVLATALIIIEILRTQLQNFNVQVTDFVTYIQWHN